MTHAADLTLFDSPIPALDAGVVRHALTEHYGLEGEVRPLPGERDLNLLLESGDGRYAVKVANPADTFEAIDLQQAALEHIDAVGCAVSVPNVRRSVDGARAIEISHEGVTYPMRVQTFLDGESLRDAEVSPFEVGVTVAAVQKSLQGFFHPGAGRAFLWDMRQLPAIADLIRYIDDPKVRTSVSTVADRYDASTSQRLLWLPAQVIHNDLHPDNLLTGGSRITGVIDFGDMIHGPRMMDLAVAAAYQVHGSDDPANTLAEVLAGYCSIGYAPDDEIAVLADLVVVRLCQTIVIGSWRAQRHPENADYISGDVAAASAALHAFESMSREAREGVAGRSQGSRIAPADDISLAQRRRRALSPGLRLSYDEPLHAVAASDVWITAADGRRYLDAYNNVVQVGHGHPLIVAAVADQTRRLNTNTRYLTDEVVDYAERLTGLLPDGLDVCYFTASGSEANDLAWRIARTVTGHEGAVVTGYAYHGSTSVIMAMSPEELPPGGTGTWVEMILRPPGTGSSGAEAVARLGERSLRPAALMIDTVMSSDGIFDLPRDYLDEAVEAVRTAGGLFIADEVQAGLGRVGERFWGFLAGSSVPDIVTLGKPLGNGYPMGAVVMSLDVAKRFSENAYFFSTFGGNTVAGAVGSVVLDITLGFDLPGNAERVGAYLRGGLQRVAASTDRLGEVRGPGLFIGVEAGSSAAAKGIVEGMRRHGVLIGRTGPQGEVLKIRPPLTFGTEHADALVEALAAVVG